MVRDFIVGRRAFTASGRGCNSPLDGFEYLSNAITAGWPDLSSFTRPLKSAVSVPLSQMPTMTGVNGPESGNAMLRAAQMSGLTTVWRAR